ncbi:protein-export membrane protein SecF [Neorickettsia helminthoeca str. Oregon]|uniref:Protein-export membrane protein SecF n=1 Tax=Neorickettsia helminthoeca str. Oregon TaxID=1286528 RepID=X5HLP9_9RICK|nr:protein translocase subunit SecF [Neorickettsia helminthoeca]AHX11345.1 protein-export membrane protein SecF [Neorickettsia helminthoeca str. Oregon]
MNFVFSRLLDHCDFDFLRYRKIAFYMSLVLTVTTFFFLGTKGLNFGIDFTGGLVLEIRSQGDINIDHLRDEMVKAQDLPAASIQRLENPRHISIKVRSKNSQETLDRVKAFLKPYNFQYERIDYVGPQIGHSLIYKSILAIGFSVLGIFIYLLFRFSYSFALAGVVTIIHDVIFLMCIYSSLAIEFNTSSVAAVLTIIGYSINDSVVIFDKLRENIGVKDLYKRINISVNTTLSRTILTSFTTMLAIAPVALLSNGDIQTFALMILSGVAIGTYSSIFISAPLALLKRHNAEKIV